MFTLLIVALLLVPATRRLLVQVIFCALAIIGIVFVVTSSINRHR